MNTTECFMASDLGIYVGSQGCSGFSLLIPFNSILELLPVQSIVVTGNKYTLSKHIPLPNSVPLDRREVRRPQMQNRPNMPITKLRLLLPRQQVGSPDHVLDLSTIQRHLRNVVQLFVRESLRVLTTQELGPDLASGCGVEFWVAKRDVDAGFKSRVNAVCTVAGEKQESLDEW